MNTVCPSGSTTKNCCGNCERYVRNPKKPGYGWCDEWGGVELSDDVVCHPYLGNMKHCGNENCKGKECPDWDKCRGESVPPWSYAKWYLDTFGKERVEPCQTHRT